MTIYAVAKGRKPGIYTTWSETEEQTKGFPGAKFKKFNNHKDAQLFINQNSTINKTTNSQPSIIDQLNTPCNQNILVVYTDGSFNKDKQQAGWGFTIIDRQTDSEIHADFGAEKNYIESWQIAGETMAVLQAIQYAIANNFKTIEINYDYKGLELWIPKDTTTRAEWRANSAIGKYYVKQIAQYQPLIDILFIKTKAHSNNKWNDRADELAKKGANL